LGKYIPKEYRLQVVYKNIGDIITSSFHVVNKSSFLPSLNAYISSYSFSFTHIKKAVIIKPIITISLACNSIGLSPAPKALSIEDIKELIASFVNAAQRSLAAGFNLIEIHAAHGYLLHEFMSPLSNQRTDEYGGSFENRIRFLCEVVQAVRNILPDQMPLWVRISAIDWISDGWDIEQSIALCHILKSLGVDLIDCSSGGIVPGEKFVVGAGYQTAFSDRLRREAKIATGAVGMITEPAQADQILRTGQADMVLIGREMLRDPYWARRAAKQLRQPVSVPKQYDRAWH
jgi:2,4-dienoyl-CoA reductase-like NADH-dependent reductase (Old Yellow Enzyme family)